MRRSASLKWAGSGLYERTCWAVTTRSKSVLKCRRVSPSSLSSTLEIRPSSNFLRKRSSWVLVSLNGGQRLTELGRKPERDGSSGQPSWREIWTAVRRRTSAYSSYEPPLISCCVSRKSGTSSSFDKV